jgi:hypothetical protein
MIAGQVVKKSGGVGSKRKRSGGSYSMEEHEDYSPVSRLIIGYLKGELSETQQQSLTDWANASEDHRCMMEEFKSVCWHVREARRFEEADKLASWSRIQQQVAQLPGAPPLPDLKEREWVKKRWICRGKNK